MARPSTLFWRTLVSRQTGFLREMTSADIRSWRDALKAKGLAAPTGDLALKVLRMPFLAAHNNSVHQP